MPRLRFSVWPSFPWSSHCGSQGSQGEKRKKKKKKNNPLEFTIFNTVCACMRAHTHRHHQKQTNVCICAHNSCQNLSVCVCVLVRCLIVTVHVHIMCFVFFTPADDKTTLIRSAKSRSLWWKCVIVNPVILKVPKKFTDYSPRKCPPALLWLRNELQF